jgi:hypothetical protein
MLSSQPPKMMNTTPYAAVRAMERPADVKDSTGCWFASITQAPSSSADTASSERIMIQCHLGLAEK